MPEKPLMTSQPDWLSQLLGLITVTGRLEIRCSYGAPWRVVYEQSAPWEIPYHVVLKGRAFLDDPGDGQAAELAEGDLVLLPHGSPHVLHDGSGRPPLAARRRAENGWIRSENSGKGERLEMLCGRFFIAPPHDRLVHGYLPLSLVVRASPGRAIDLDGAHGSVDFAGAGGSDGGDGTVDSARPGGSDGAARSAGAEGSDGLPGGVQASSSLSGLVGLMRGESVGDRLGGYAMFNALSSALFTLALRAASAAEQAPKGLLALAGHPRLAPAITAMFGDPAKAWTLPELAALCSMSRATFMRHFQDKLGRSAIDMLTDIRMSMAANELRKPSASTEAVADAVGYQSVSAFRRVFTQWMGKTPGEWRRSPARDNEASAIPGEDIATQP
jgi:AraC family transcriptional activator of mtrCDE